ncbi:hypothetical protein PVAP13_8NG325524 [Panicum virgatum]|uniref:Uncharacterized protein n=1 Tax=Panicum virgatum TaxID=38727 RepID=A0A8T0PE50_PANVG|nr:hypothetical protein PVAP13_8NG325524 [Panicum virgatum]
MVTGRYGPAHEALQPHVPAPDLGQHTTPSHWIDARRRRGAGDEPPPAFREDRRLQSPMARTRSHPTMSASAVASEAPPSSEISTEGGGDETARATPAGTDKDGEAAAGTAPPEGTTRETNAKKKQQMDGDDDQAAAEEEEEERTKLVPVEHAYIDAVQARYYPEQKPSLPNMPEELFQFVPDHLRDRLRAVRARAAAAMEASEDEGVLYQYRAKAIRTGARRNLAGHASPTVSHA